MQFFNSPLLNGRPWLDVAPISIFAGWFGDGTQAAPSISFVSETGLGLFRASAGVLGIASGGALATSFSSTGQVWPAKTGTFAFNGINVTSTDALVLANGNNAALGAQQMSPRLRISGFGWGTTAGTSQACDWIVENLPVQSTVPGGNLRFRHSVTGGIVNQWAANTGVTYTITNSGSGEVDFLLNRSGGTVSSWIWYLPAASTQIRLFGGGTDRISIASATGDSVFSGSIRANGGFIGSAGTVGLTQAITACLGRSITLENGLVTAFA